MRWLASLIISGLAASTALAAPKAPIKITYDAEHLDLDKHVLQFKFARPAKTAELTKKWEDMSAGLPKMVDALRSRVDILGQAKQLPAKVSKATFDEAKAGLATIDQTWAEAQAAFKGGKLEDALAKATTVKDKAAEIMTKLGMPVPAAAKS